MKEFYEERLELLKSGESFVLASIFDSQGSAPRTTGARMIIKKDGSIIGTVGGGKVELLVIQDGINIFDTKATILKEYKLQEVENKGIGMACGGDVSILMEYVEVEKHINIKLYEEVVNCIEKGEKASIIRKFYNDGNSINYLYKNGKVIFSSNDIEKEEVEKYSDVVRYRDLVLIKEENAYILIEPICNLGRLYIFGAGHVGQALEPILRYINFTTKVIDDRPDFANRERFPDADEVVVI